MADIVLQKPLTGQHITYEAQGTGSITLTFAVGNTALSRAHDSLVFTFNDGSSVSVNNFYTSYNAKNAPDFIMEDKTVSAERFFADVDKKLMLDADNTPQGSGGSVDFIHASLFEEASSLRSLSPLDTLDNNNRPSSASNTVSNVGSGIAQTHTATFGPALGGTASPDSSITPTLPTQYGQYADFLAGDAGSHLSGNILANDNLSPEDTIIDMQGPKDWTKTVDDTGKITFTDNSYGSVFEIAPNGDYTFSPEFDARGVPDMVFEYTVQKANGETHTSHVTMGDDKGLTYEVDTLQGDSFTLSTRDENSVNNTYTLDISGSRGGVPMGAGNDTIYVETARSSHIYGDSMHDMQQSHVGNDSINVRDMDDTKIYGDGELYNGIHGGNDTIQVDFMKDNSSISGDGEDMYPGSVGGNDNIEVMFMDDSSISGDGKTMFEDSVGGDDNIQITHMESGSISGDGENMRGGSVGGDDTISIGTMNSGAIYGDGIVQEKGTQGGNDVISADTLDTTLVGNQSLIIDGNGGNDTIDIRLINTSAGDSITINGGEGHDMFNFNSDADDTLYFSGDKLSIAEKNVDITNIEGLSTGSGHDLIKIYDLDAVNGFDFSHLIIDGGDDIDTILANASNQEDIEKMIENNQFSNTEYVVFSDTLNNNSTTNTEDLFNKITGITQDASGNLSFESGWTQGADVNNYASFSDSSGITILVAKSQLENFSG